MSTLADYFTQSNDKPSDLARRLDVAPSTITRIMNGERRASVDLARRIEAETAGRVTAAVLLGLSSMEMRAGGVINAPE